jgi:hypothetical protein
MGRLDRGNKVEGYLLQRDTLYWTSRRGRDKKLVVPTAAIPMVFAYFHDVPLGGHFGVHKTLRMISQHFTWQAFDKEIRSTAPACHICYLSKPAQNMKLEIMASEVSQRLIQKVFIDYVGKFPRSRAGNTAIILCVSAFSKFGWFLCGRLLPERRLRHLK